MPASTIAFPEAGRALQQYEIGYQTLERIQTEIEKRCDQQRDVVIDIQGDLKEGSGGQTLGDVIRRILNAMAANADKIKSLEITFSRDPGMSPTDWSTFLSPVSAMREKVRAFSMQTTCCFWKTKIDLNMPASRTQSGYGATGETDQTANPMIA